MNSTLRKATPDSEAVASSEDERPWPRASSFGTLLPGENGVPGLGGGIWSNRKRGSFKMEKAAPRNVVREARLGAVNQSLGGFRPESTPSPSASDGSGALPFSIPLQPTPKTGRSLSHSQGQREAASAGRLRSGSIERNMVRSLGFLPEEVDTETESEVGGGLTHTTSHPPMATLHRTSTYPPTLEALYGTGHQRDSPIASGDAQLSGRKLENALSNMSLDPSHPHRRSQWQSHLGWDDVLHVNESRRHSLADIPTRRGSLAGADLRPSMTGASYWHDGGLYDWQEEEAAPGDAQAFVDKQSFPSFGATGTALNKTGEGSKRAEPLSTLPYSDKDEQTRQIDIPTMYKVPTIKLAEHQRSEQDKSAAAAMSNVGQWGNRPRKQLYIISFKCSRVDVFYLLENTGLFIKEGDIVIVEADRGQDLGTVQHANVTPDEARLYKRMYGEEQYKWLMMFSKNNQAGNVNPNAQLFGENNSGGGRGGGNNGNNNLMANAAPTMQGLSRDNFANLKPKAIKRLANTHEIHMLSEKEGNEAKAKRACQQKVAHLQLDMEILDAEWQWDFQKLIFYYYADHYINFKDLITELYRIYKTRIWLSAINPASFSQHALGQPPTAITPGAVPGFGSPLNNTYTMMYGADPDPYGAVPPYRIGYETYTPNYPGIPGVSNSFAPGANAMPGGGAAGHFQPYTGGGADVNSPSHGGGTPTAGSSSIDYNYYGSGGGGVGSGSASEQQTPKAFPPHAPFAGSATPTGPMFNPMYPMAPPGTDPNEPGAFGFGAYPPPPFGGGPAAGFGNSPFGQGGPGFGRASGLPAPIGTRPADNPAQSPSSFGPPGQNLSPRGRGFPSAARAAPDFVPGQQLQQPRGPMGSGSPFTGLGGMNFGGMSPPLRGEQFKARPEGIETRGNWARLSGGDGGKADLMRSYLDGLAEKEGGGRHGPGGEGEGGEGGGSSGAAR